METTTVETCEYCGNEMHYGYCLCDKSQLVRMAQNNDMLREEIATLRHALQKVREEFSVLEAKVANIGMIIRR